jgi:hypothetical protein
MRPCRCDANIVRDLRKLLTCHPTILSTARAIFKTRHLNNDFQSDRAGRDRIISCLLRVCSRSCNAVCIRQFFDLGVPVTGGLLYPQELEEAMKENEHFNGTYAISREI